MSSHCHADCLGSWLGADPIFEALRGFSAARELHDAALRELDAALVFPGEAPSRALVEWTLYRMIDLEEAEAAAAKSLHGAEKQVLETPPATVGGSRALLAFLQSYLAAEPDVGLAITAIGNVAAALSISAEGSGRD